MDQTVPIEINERNSDLCTRKDGIPDVDPTTPIELNENFQFLYRMKISTQMLIKLLQ